MSRRLKDLEKGVDIVSLNEKINGRFKIMDN